MRPCALLLSVALGLSSLVGLFNPTAYAAAALKVSTTQPFLGQQVVFSGDIGSGPARVVLQGSAKKGWVNSRTATTKADGKFRFQVATSTRRSFRVVVSGTAVRTNTLLLVPQRIDRAPVQATLSKPKKPYVNQTFKLSGSTGGSVARTVLLQGSLNGRWVTSRKKTATKGQYSFSITSAFPSRNFRVLVLPSGTLSPLRSPLVTVETKKNDVSLVMSRAGRSSKIVASGYLSADLDGRPVQLQRLAKKTWVNVGQPHAQANNGVGFGGLGRSTAYRLVARAAKGGAPQVVSNAAALAIGPASIGDRVAYVQTRNGGTPTKKGKDYKATIMINGKLATLETIAVRGNSSATYPKRGYKIKFDDNISPLPTIPTGKTFNLLPNYQDRSLIRTAVAFTVANQLTGMQWNPNRAFVELYLNGKYKGAFDLIESIKIEQVGGKSAPRINVDPRTGVVLEIDPYGAQDGVPHWKSKKSKLPFKFKDPDSKKSGKDAAEGITAAKATGMKKKVEKFESVLYGSKWKDKNNGWTRYMDLNSAVDWYLMKEFIKDWDGDMYRSNFVWTRNYSPNSPEKLIMSPLWDVDRSAAAKTSGTSNVTSPAGWWMNGDGGGHLNNTDNVHTTHWFVRITKDPRFQSALRARWRALKKPDKGNPFKAAGDQYAGAAYRELGSNVANNDRKLWAKTGDAKRYQARTTSPAREVAFVKNWYQKRYVWMNARLK